MLESAWDFWKKMEKEVDASSGTKGKSKARLKTKNVAREVNFKTHKDGEKESEVKTKIMNEGNTKVTKEEPDNNKTIKVEVESSQKQNKIEPNRSDVPESQIVENELGDDLIDAVKDENVDKVKSLLEKKCPPDVADEDQGMTALMWAASLDNIEIGKTLIEAKASVNVKAENDSTPLVAAASTGSCKMLSLLLDKNANIQAHGPMLGTPLMWAAAENHTEAMKLLIEGKANINTHKGERITPLMWAAEQNCADAAKLLVEAKANVNMEDAHGRTPAMIAAWNNAKDVARILLNSPIEINLHKVDKDQHSAVSLARMRKNYTMINILDPNAVSRKVAAV